MSGLGTRFDWYEATWDDDDEGRVALRLAAGLGGGVSRGRPRNGYAECYSIDRAGDALVKVYGRSARAGEVHIETTSTSCDDVVPLVRRLYPFHRVSRADSSVDFKVGFEELDARAVAFAAERRVSYRLVTDSAGGATRYLGAPSSELRVRVYKKTEQLRALHPERAAEIPEGIVRVELQARPGKSEIKAAAAVLTADDVWGLGQWSRDFAEELLGIDAQRTATHFRRPSDWSRALHYLGQQYAPLIARQAAQQGSAEVRQAVLTALGLAE